MSTTTIPAQLATTGAARPVSEPDALAPHDVDRVVATMVVAFADDPVIRWVFPTGSHYLAGFPELVRVLSDDAFTGGGSDRTDGGTGAALWVRPGTPVPEQELVALLERSVEPDRHTEAFAFLEQVSAHHPEEPHWYLPFIGVDPRVQGRGLGSKLLRTGLARCDREAMPAYLEASSPRNRALYERHGFRVVAEVRAGDSPPLWPMWRPER